MSDTQWPRYEVFKQDKLGKPHESVGSVHASDPEMALLNARNVFVRRPSAISLWVVPATAVFIKTAEELAADPHWWQIDNIVAGPEKAYQIFTKTSQRRAMTFVAHAGYIKAMLPEFALRQALDSGQFGKPVYVWWVVPNEAITRSEESDIPSFFDPAFDKKFRQQGFYGFVSPARKERGKHKP